jgi:hypothetical protein
MSRDDATDLIARPDNGIDVTALREEAAVIRQNLDELAADRALGLIDRSQMLAATERANHRLGQIGDQLTEAARENVLTELVTATSVATAWDQMDLSRQRAVLKNLMTLLAKEIADLIHGLRGISNHAMRPQLGVQFTQTFPDSARCTVLGQEQRLSARIQRLAQIMVKEVCLC